MIRHGFDPDVRIQVPGFLGDPLADPVRAGIIGRRGQYPVVVKAFEQTAQVSASKPDIGLGIEKGGDSFEAQPCLLGSLPRC